LNGIKRKKKNKEEEFGNENTQFNNGSVQPEAGFQSHNLTNRRILSSAPFTYISLDNLKYTFKSKINKYKNRRSANENQLIKDLFTQTLEGRRLKRF
jgi:hypothetical protein